MSSVPVVPGNSGKGGRIFTVACCGTRRGNVNGVLICPKCDYDHAKATVIPNDHAAKDVPKDAKFFTPVRVTDA